MEHAPAHARDRAPRALRVEAAADERRAQQLEHLVPDLEGEAALADDALQKVREVLEAERVAGPRGRELRLDVREQALAPAVPLSLVDVRQEREAPRQRVGLAAVEVCGGGARVADRSDGKRAARAQLRKNS